MLLIPSSTRSARATLFSCGCVASYSSLYAPTPTPRITRPPVNWSSVATCLASTTGCRIGSTITPVIKRIVLVLDAQYAYVMRGSKKFGGSGQRLRT